MKRLAGKSAIVTGGGDGIGHGIVRRFASEGAHILVADLNAETGQRTADAAARDFGVEAEFLKVDIKRVENKSDADIDHGITMGLYAAMWAMQAAFPLMKAKGWGRVVNMCSLNGVNAHIGSAEYNVGKEALRAYSRTAAREWAPYGITCNIVCPASISASYRAFRDANPETAATMDGMNPMGRMGDPEADIAPVIAFLSSEDCRYMTGNTLFVDGGGHINGVAWAPELPDAA
jgi:NAD(P)-dependent dehydrogenase (short-subunit alcohol dehydrogenase family)